MARSIKVRGIRRKQIDEDKLALAFLLLAKTLHEQTGGVPADERASDHPTDAPVSSDSEAA